MSRYAKTLIVIVASVAVGACAGRTRIVVNTQTASLADQVVADTQATEESPIDILPIRNIEFAGLMVGTADEPKNLDPTPACDVAAVVAQTHADPELAAYRIAAGKQLYSYTETRYERTETYQDYVLDIGLRVLDLETCTTRVIGVQKAYGKEGRRSVAALKVPAGWSIEVVVRANGIEWNNWATDFEIVEPSDHIVVGVRWPHVPKNQVRGQSRVTPITYVPYSRGLHLDPLIIAGREYLDEVVREAYEELRRLRVPSRTFPNTLVADVDAIEPGFVTSLAANEHMDPGEFGLDPQWTADRIHIVIGANRERTAAYTCSGASACGLMQFMDGTYRDMRRLYPAAKLMADSTQGRRDHLNAMKAAILLHDNNLAYFRERMGEAEFTRLLGDRTMRRELLTSAYNTGAGRTATVYLIHRERGPAEWTDARGKRCGKANRYAECLLVETKGYIAKDRFLDSWRSKPLAVKP